jgi:hypothetical protein
VPGRGRNRRATDRNRRGTDRGQGRRRPVRDAARASDDGAAGQSPLLLIERARVAEPVAVEVDRPLAHRPRVTGFWRGTEFHLVTRLIATRQEHDATYYRVLTSRGAFDLRNIRRMEPLTLRIRRVWELCAELDVVPVARFR